jgi:superfamily II DNA or RNA helicase
VKKDIILYCSSISDAEIFTKNLENSAMVTADTPKKEREKIKNPEI